MAGIEGFVSGGETELPTVRAIADYTPERHLLLQITDDHAQELLARSRDSLGADAEGADRLVFEHSAPQVRELHAAIERLRTTEAADAATANLAGEAEPTVTVMLSLSGEAVEQLYEGFDDYAPEAGGQWFVELPGLAAELFVRALTAAVEGESEPTETAMAELRAER
jgi:hypothetical protein